MFVGHLAFAYLLPVLGFSGSFAALLLCCQLSDVFFFSFVLSGVEHMRLVPGFTAVNDFDLYDMPYTHSLLGSVILSLLVVLLTRKPAYGIATLSHWFGDLPFHVADLTLAGGGDKFGLGLWRHRWLSFGTELAVFLLAVAVAFAASTRASSVQERRAMKVIFVVCLVMHAMNGLQVLPATSVRELSVQALLAYFALPLVAFWMAQQQSRRRKE